MTVKSPDRQRQARRHPDPRTAARPAEAGTETAAGPDQRAMTVRSPHQRRHTGGRPGLQTDSRAAEAGAELLLPASISAGGAV